MAQTNVQAFSGDVDISSNLAVSGSKFTYDNSNTTVFTGTATAEENEIGYLDMSTSSTSNNIHVKVYIKYGQSSSLGEAEYSFYMRPNTANFSLIYDYRNKSGPITPVVYRTNASDLYSGGTSGVVRFGYSIAASQNIVWRVEVYQRSNNVTFYPTNTGSAVDTTGLVQVSPAPYARFDSNVMVSGNVGIGTNNPQEALHVAGSVRLGAAEGVDDDNLKSIVTTSPLEVHSNAEDLDGLGVSLNLRSGFSDSESNIQMLSSKSNTGFQYISFATATTERMRILTNGKVGIGSTTPTGQLELHGEGQTSFTSFNQAGNMGGTLVLRSDDGALGSGGAVMFGSHAGFNAAIKASLLDGGTNTVADLNFFTRSGTGDATMSQKMVIRGNGNVGIGTTEPGGHLQVFRSGDAGIKITSGTTSNSTIYFGDTDDNNKSYIDYDNNNEWMTFQSNGGNRMRISSAGYVTIGPYVASPRFLLDIPAHYSPNQLGLVIQGGSGASNDAGVCGIGFNSWYNKQNVKTGILNAVESWGRGTMHFCSVNSVGSGSLSDRIATTNSRMHIRYDGLIGLGSSFTSPAKVYVKTEASKSLGGAWSPGDFVVSHGVGTNAPSQSLGVGIGVDYNGNDGTSGGYIWCMRPNITWNKLLLQANQIVLSGISSVILGSGANVTSDDRLKTDEALIKNATSTLMKLKPQTYNKYKNLPNSGDEHRLDGAGIPYNKSVMEAGLIVQDVYYDAPELKHLVLLSDDAIPQETKPEEPVPGDIQQDPDYSDWGVSPSGLNYTGLTPYIIKSIQEINMELPRHKTKIDGISFSNISAYHNLIVSKDNAVRLSNTYNDKTVYGVISETEASTDDSEVLVNYQGDGKVWVINTSNIEAGDYITTSNVGGYGMKQGTDFTMNYTLAKSTIACDFTQPHITEKRKVQELRDVTYWSVTQNINISKKRYDFIASNNVNLVSTTAEIHYSNVSVEELTGNTVYSNITTQEYSNLESDEQNNYTEVSETKYYFTSTREYSLDPGNTTSNVIVRQEYVDVLDTNGQLQWEDTGNTVSMYELRYLNSDGIQTDEANAVYKAALIDCTFKTG